MGEGKSHTRTHTHTKIDKDMAHEKCLNTLVIIYFIKFQMMDYLKQKHH